ncbi:MAG: amidase [Vicinamibacterales bacterium]
MALADSRRRFLAYCSSAGLASTLLPGVLWEKLLAGTGGQAPAPEALTPEMLASALAVAGLEYGEDERRQMLRGVQGSLRRYVERRDVAIDPDVAPPLHFSPLVPGMRVDRTSRPFRASPVTDLARPRRLDDLAFWPVLHLAHLVRTRQVTSVELTELFLARLAAHGPALNCVITLTADLARAQARQADRELADGRDRGPLHGIPWGCKDILAVPGYPTTWGSNAFRTRVIDTEAAVAARLREAGAVLVAKLSTGEMASGEYWFGGRTNNPWDLSEGASGSSCGPAAATAAGLVAFSIGTDTGGSILFPATRCGATGLRPTFGRVSRFGCMSLQWSRDRIGPICRTAEDCALVFRAIAGPDDRDGSVQDVPVHWDASMDVRTLSVGYLEPTGADEGRTAEWTANDHATLDRLRALGVRLEPFVLPPMRSALAGAGVGAEASAYFEDVLQSGADRDFTNPTRANGFRQGRLVPAVEYLQAQRIRAMVMRQHFATVGRFDVYLAPSNNPPLNPPGGSGGGVVPDSPRNLTRDHHDVSNLCGLPALSVPNGVYGPGRPTSLTFHGRPFGEAAVIALAHAWQRATDWHLRPPPPFA